MKNLEDTKRRLKDAEDLLDDLLVIYAKQIHPDYDLIKKINELDRIITNAKININQIKTRKDG